jgi:hypothetical protein
MTNKVFPQDNGTGHYPAGEGDYDHAAYFASAFNAVGFSDFVKSGLELTPNFTTPSVNVSAGKAVISAPSTSTSTGEAITAVSYIVEFDGTTGVALVDNTVNHVFLELDPDTPDTINVVVNQDGSSPLGGPSLKIGEVDTTANTTTQVNRGALDGLSGELSDPQTPKVHGDEAHSESYVKSTQAGTIYVSDTEPSSPSVNDIWFDTTQPV